jgi:hypothetical protein
MLRVTQALELHFRKRNSALSAEFLKGFALALAFHLLFYFTFPIAKMQHLERSTPLQPIAVEVDLSKLPLVASPTIHSLPILQRAAGSPSCSELYVDTVFCNPQECLASPPPLDEPTAITLPYCPLPGLLEEEDD